MTTYTHCMFCSVFIQCAPADKERLNATVAQLSANYSAEHKQLMQRILPETGMFLLCVCEMFLFSVCEIRRSSTGLHSS